MNTSRRLQRVLQLVMPPLLVLLIVAVFAVIHLQRHYQPERLTADGMDYVQSARYYARTGQFGTEIIRPLLTGFTPLRGDGTEPDLGHSPIYIMMVSTAMKTLHQVGPNQGDKAAAIVSLAAWIGSIVAVFLLSRRLFLTNSIAALASFVYAFGSGAGLLLSLTPHPATLAALLYPLLMLALALLDKRENEAALRKRAVLGWSLLAGIFYALLFLSVYSTLILMPLFLWHIWRVTGKTHRFQAVPVFIVAFVLTASPYFYRNFLASRNPLFNSRSLELIMQTQSNPGYTLYRATSLNQGVGQYLTGGGYKEVLQKSLDNMSAYCQQLPSAFGLLLLPLYVGAGIIRFDDGRTNRLRNLAYGTLGLHFLGLSFYQTASENVPLFLMHQAVAAAYAVGFLTAIIRARNLRIYFARTATIGWVALAALPGLIVYISGPGVFPAPYNVYTSLNTAGSMNAVRIAAARSGKGYLASDSPWELAYRCDTPAVWLPRDSSDINQVVARSGRPIVAVIMTPALISEYSGDTTIVPWQTTYLRLGALWSISAPLDSTTRNQLINKVKLYYPDALTTALAKFRPEPIEERDSTQYTFFLWNPDITEVKQVPN